MVNYKSMKKFLVAVSLIICAFMFCGCSSAEMLVKENYDGSVDVYYAIDYKMSEFVEDGTITEEDYAKMKSAIETKASELIAKSKSEFRFSIAKWYAKGKLTESERANMYNQLKIYTGWTNDVFAVKYSFADEKTYNVYTNFGEDVQVVRSSEKSLFVTKYSEKVLNTFARKRTLFNGKSAFEYFSDEINAYLSANFEEQTIPKFPDFEMTYSYLTTSSRLHSDADQVAKTNEGTIHTWRINKENQNRMIELYSLRANPMVWYILALTICFVFVAIYLIVIYFKKERV